MLIGALTLLPLARSLRTNGGSSKNAVAAGFGVRLPRNNRFGECFVRIIGMMWNASTRAFKKNSLPSSRLVSITLDLAQFAAPARPIRRAFGRAILGDSNAGYPRATSARTCSDANFIAIASFAVGIEKVRIRCGVVTA